MTRKSPIDRVAEAFKRKDYRTAARLLNPLLKTHGDDPWVQLYAARLHELSGKGDVAEPLYRELLRNTVNPNPRILAQARQGLQRLEARDRDRRQAALVAAREDPRSAQPGVLVLEPIAPDDRREAALAFARILAIDPYSARLQLPSRGWRLYRVGPVGELRVYAQDLRQAGIPAFHAAIADLEALRVFQVRYWQRVAPKAQAICEDEAGQLGALEFDWSEVARRVDGQLPVFESVVDLDARGRPIRKETTQDYVRVCDLHLPQRRAILRLADNRYRFHTTQHPRGIDFSPPSGDRPAAEAEVDRASRRMKWNEIVAFLDRQLAPVPRLTDFVPFAETVMDWAELLGRLDAHIILMRREASLWDPAFHLYSGLAFLRSP